MTTCSGVINYIAASCSGPISLISVNINGDTRMDGSEAWKQLSNLIYNMEGY